MSDRVLLDWIPGERAVYYQEVDGEAYIVTDYFMPEELADRNKALREASEGRFGDYRLIASMPPNELRATGMEEAIRQGDDPWVSRFLMDSDNRIYKATRGRV